MHPIVRRDGSLYRGPAMGPPSAGAAGRWPKLPVPAHCCSPSARVSLRVMGSYGALKIQSVVAASFRLTTRLPGPSGNYRKEHHELAAHHRGHRRGRPLADGRLCAVAELPVVGGCDPAGVGGDCVPDALDVWSPGRVTV